MGTGRRIMCCRCDKLIPPNSKANRWFCKHCWTVVSRFDKWNKEIEKEGINNGT